jgi:hypothetical protein
VLYSDEDKETLEAGVNTMPQVAAKLLGKKAEDPGRQLQDRDKKDDPHDPNRHA